MNEWNLIIALAATGFGLMLVEIFLPGMIVGIIGGMCCVVSVGVAFAKHGAIGGLITLLVELIVISAGFMIWMRVFPHTPMGKRMLLQDQSGPAPIAAKEHLVDGSEGLAMTSLRPAGTAEFAARRYDVVAEREFIEQGEKIKVVRLDRFRVVVRKI
jgi:membrane-bound serine protease (ClpP class)